MNRHKNIFIVVLVGVFLSLGANALYSSGVDTMSDRGATDERYWCLYDCKERYGLEYMFRGGGGSMDVWRLYYACVSACERKFWKEWEKELDENK